MTFAGRHVFSSRRRAIVSLCCFLAAAPGALALTNGLALTPPMGFNTWYAYGSSITEDIIKSITDQMATNGLLSAGYQYINLDDGWAGFRDTNGVLVADTNKFPSGMKALADYVHAKGFKFGLYCVAGTNTCAGRPGSGGYEIQDAKTFAAWGVDFVKFEACNMPWYEIFPHEEVMSQRMSQAILQSGQPMVFSQSISKFENWVPNASNQPRGTGDLNGTWTNALYHIDVVAQSPFRSRPGMFNDPDVVPVGLTASLTEDRSVISMWSVLAAPLLTATIVPYRIADLCNPEVVAVDQDPAGIQGWCVASHGDAQVWCKPLGASNSSTMAVALLNRGDRPLSITAQWSDLGLLPGIAVIRDLWARANEANGDVGDFIDSYTVAVPPHGVKFLKITGNAALPLPPVGTIFLSDLEWLATTTNQFDPIQRDRWVGSPPGPIVIDGLTYPKGLSFQANSRADYYLGRTATRFQCDLGIDDRACCLFASATFRVYLDAIKIYDSGIMFDNTPTKTIDLDVSGGNILSLELWDSDNGSLRDIGDWAMARLIVPPRPRIGQFDLHVNSITLGGSNGAPNGVFYLLGSTNLSQPLNQWIPIRTNLFDLNGNFVLSNLALPNVPAMFFRLKLQ